MGALGEDHPIRVNVQMIELSERKIVVQRKEVWAVCRRSSSF
jgi:hypothetical protein